jgi:RND family efflux transporter MFP subunit
VRVAEGNLTRSFEAGGVVRARTTAVLTARIMAEVRDVRVRPGDVVRAGQTLVTLDGREPEANLARAAATVVAAEQAARAARSDQQAAAAALQLATSYRDRLAILHEKDEIAAHQFDEAVAKVRLAGDALEGATARIAEADATLAAARSTASAARVTASYTIITAPFAGVVTSKDAEPGNMTAPGAPLVTVEDTRAFRLEARLDEARAAQVAPGQAVTVALDQFGALDDSTGPAWQSARVAEVSRTLDPGSHTFIVKVDLPAAPGLRSGMFGRMRFAGETRRALVMPATSLLRRGQLTAMFVVDAEGRARFRPIATGETNDGRVEVVSGLQPGDTVVLAPPVDLRDGMAVKAQTAARLPEVHP